MKHYLMLLPFCIIAGQAQDIQWEKSYGGRQADYLLDIQPTADYGFILAGSSISTKSGNKTENPNGNLDYWIWKMDEHGKEDWQKSFGGQGSDFLHSVRTTSDGGFILGGTSNSISDPTSGKTTFSFGNNDYWIIKLNAKGEQEWQKSFGGSGDDDLTSVIPTKDGGYLIGGSSSSELILEDNNLNLQKGIRKDDTKGNVDYWIIKIDSNGEEQWQHSYGGQFADVLKSMEQTSDGGYILGGYSNSPLSNTKKGDKTEQNFGQGNDFWILKINNKGDIQWQQTIGGDKDDQLFVLHQSYDKGYILGGNSNSDISGNKNKANKNGSDFWMIKLNEQGNIDWQETYDFGKNDILTSLIENEDHTILIGGFTHSDKTKDKEGIDDYIALKVSENGEILWDRSVGSEGKDILSKAIMTRDGGYLMAGTSNPESAISTTKKRSASSSVAGIDTSRQLAGAQKAQQAVDKTVKDYDEKVNNYYNEKANSIKDEVQKASGLNGDSPLKVGGEAGNILNTKNSPENITQSSQQQGPKPNVKSSRDKKTNYGGMDFWVVKLKDKQKKEKTPAKIEAFPNPTVSFTNVIIGFDFNKGNAALYDLSGRQLQSFPIDNRTVPVDLSGYPEGIYIIKVTTDKGDGSMKIIKGIGN